MPSASESEKPKDEDALSVSVSVSVFDTFPIKDLIALEEDINRKLLLCILLRYTGMASTFPATT